MPRPQPFVLSILLLAAPRAAFAQCPVPPLQVTTGAMDGGRAIVNDAYASLPAHVQFFDKTPQGWQPVQLFLIGEPAVFHQVQVALKGDRAIAASPEATGGDFLSGRAFVFDRVGSQWVATELHPATQGQGDLLGTAVAIDGNVAVVAASHDIEFSDFLPRVHVFEFDGASWNERAQIPGHYGPVAVEGDWLALGDEGYQSGNVDVFRRVSGIWAWNNRFAALHTQPPDGPVFGVSLAFDGGRLAVGAAHSTTASWPGYVEIFRVQGSYLMRDQHLVPADTAAYDSFGQSVALEGPTLLVGAPGPGSPGGRGLVHRFEDDGANFVETGSFGDPSTGIGFGQRIAFSGEDAIFARYSTGSFFRLGFAATASFCPTTPNSTGAVATLSVEGCDSLAGERITLAAAGLPPGALVHFLVGANTAQVPFGDGFRCIGDPFFRVTGGASDASGSLARDLDFRTSPADGFSAGSTWHFQAAYRDPASSGARLNTSNALSVRITP